MQPFIRVSPKFRPVLDPDFVPASLWNRCFHERVRESGKPSPLALALQRADGSLSVFRTAVLPHEGSNVAANERYVERLLKFLLWQKGGYRVLIGGDPRIARFLQSVYTPSGARAFDFRFMGDRVYGHPMIIEPTESDRVPAEREGVAPLGRHLEGCRIGFDLGASDRKAAAVIDGEVVFSEEVSWDPSRQADPQYHFDGIHDSLKRAAAKLPRVDAIGGSAAGVYVNNEVRVGSLYRGIPQDLFDRRVRRLFFELQEAWGGIPFEVVNDGEVTALAGSMALNDNAVLGIAFGSSLAAGYVTPQGNITGWLNELAFVPVDYREKGPVDEWSGDEGVGALYFSQQAVGRLLPAAGIELPNDMPLAAKLVEVQKLMAARDDRARRIYQTIGTYLGYSVAHFADFYEIRNLLVLGRVMTGEGGDVILSTAAEVLKGEFPAVAESIHVHTPGETEKRHGQAVAAASLPSLKR
ncbi:MAG: ROK family protein [Acidobacteriia bacterium]|nr:ROK family protein [Terriglobia bacterium]